MKARIAAYSLSLSCLSCLITATSGEPAGLVVGVLVGLCAILQLKNI